MVIALDLDGTLLDSRRRHIEVARAAIRSLGMPMVDLDAYWQAKREGQTTAELLGDDAARIWENEIEDPRWLALDEAFPDVQSTLQSIWAAGASPLIVTARRDATAVRRQVDEHWSGIALAVVDPMDPVRQKARVLEDRGAAALIGDTESDARAARRAGIDFVAVSRGQRSDRFLRIHGVALICPDLGAAWAAVQSITNSV